MATPPSERFLIFALARTGSASLAAIFRCHPEIRVLREPFNPYMHDGEYARMVRDGRSLDAALDRIWNQYTGFKHVWDPYGWPFGDGGELNRHLLSSGTHKILFLTRRNSLRRLVSLQIAKQTDMWTLENADDRGRFSRCQLRSLNRAGLRDGLARTEEAVDSYRALLRRSGREWMDVWYEDLFSADVPGEDQLRRIDALLAFLGQSTLDRQAPEVVDAMRRVLDPEVWRMNSETSYLRIPEILEVEREFGSDRVGWLFKGR